MHELRWVCFLSYLLTQSCILPVVSPLLCAFGWFPVLINDSERDECWENVGLC